MMKNLLKYILTLTLVAIIAPAMSQIIKPLKVGDKVPNIQFDSMLNHSAANGNLSDFKGKAMIIDMWFANCVPCVAGMRHLDSLQKEFKDELQILPATWEPKAEIENFWATNLNVQGIRLTQVVQQKSIREYFPARSFPHQIWINKEGIIVAITGSNNSSRENVKKLLAGEALDFVEKKDEMDNRVASASDPNMVIRYEENKDKLLYYSYFSKRRDEFTGRYIISVDTNKKKVRVTFNNVPLLTLYHNAYANVFGTPMHGATRMIRRDHSPIKTTHDLSKSGLTAETYCYDLIYSGTDKKRFGKYMVADLDRAFNLKSHEEFVDIPCLVISPNGKGVNFQKPLIPNGGTQVINSRLKTNEKLIVNKKFVGELCMALNYHSEMLLLFEMGGKEMRINFSVNWNVDNLEQMNKELSAYDLKIEKTIHKRGVIILEDAD